MSCINFRVLKIQTSTGIHNFYSFLQKLTEKLLTYNMETSFTVASDHAAKNASSSVFLSCFQRKCLKILK